MSDDAVLMTREDFEALQAETQRLETDRGAEIAERIKTAREWGDLKENAEYHDAKNDQAMLETKILRLRERLLHAEIRTGETAGDVVEFGSRVSVLDEATGSEISYTLVASDERGRRQRQAVGRLTRGPRAHRRPAGRPGLRPASRRGPGS